MADMSELLKSKAIEAFLLAIEIYNKPTIKYRIEGFSLFIVNAWELMLKSYLIRRDGESAIYFPDNPNRTIALENCIRKVFTNDKDPLRLNLEKIIELRNTSTHFITEEYEVIYAPLFQANVLNFSDKISELLGVDITEHIPENFLSLTVSFRAIDEKTIRGKYSDAVSTRLLENYQRIADLSSANLGGRFAITIEHKHYITKKKAEATNIVHFARDGEDPVLIFQKQVDPMNTHPFTAKFLMARLNEKLKRANISLLYGGNIAEVNRFHFKNLCKYFDIKSNKSYCYVDTHYKEPRYVYSQKAIDFLFELLEKEPEHILDTIAKKKQS